MAALTVMADVPAFPNAVAAVMPLKIEAEKRGSGDFSSMWSGQAAALGPALQSVGINWGYYLLNAAPYFLTLTIMIITSDRRGTLSGMPGEFVK